MRGLLIAALVALAATGQPAQAVPPTAAPAAAPVRSETASALARTIAPADLMIPREMDVARKAILTLPTLDSDAKQLEQDYPGIWAAVWTASEPEMLRSVTADFPKFWGSLEQLYRSRLAESEAQAILTFYRSDTGQRLLRGMVDNFDATPLIADAAKSPTSTVSAEQMKVASEAAKAAALKRLQPGDTLEFLALMHFVELDKFKAIGAETQKLTLEWVNREDPEGDEKLQKIMQAAMKDYIAKHPAKK